MTHCFLLLLVGMAAEGRREGGTQLIRARAQYITLCAIYGNRRSTYSKYVCRRVTARFYSIASSRLRSVTHSLNQAAVFQGKEKEHSESKYVLDLILYNPTASHTFSPGALK